MAKLGKGILGAPTGVIGSVNCYNRLGKSVIQSRSFPVDSFARRWNLLKWQLSNRLAYHWKLLGAFQQSIWSGSAPVGYTGKSYFYALNLAYSFSNKQPTLSNGKIMNRLGFSFFTLEFGSNGIGNDIYVRIINDGLMVPPAGDLIINIRYFKTNQSLEQTVVNVGAMSYDWVYAGRSLLSIDNYLFAEIRPMDDLGIIKYNLQGTPYYNSKFDFSVAP